MKPLSWDIFCSVIDNFGDIGVCWRLARQLRHEHGHDVRLWVDDLHTFAKFAPHPGFASQFTVNDVEIRHWSQPLPSVEPHDVVVEAFGCNLPDSFVRAMSSRDVAPTWLNLEYLSAESWIEGCHRLSSRHAELPLTRYFFFPGFTAKTGGLLRERALLDQRDRFLADSAAQSAWCDRAGIHADDIVDRQLISLFCYDNRALGPLLDHWEQGDAKTILVADGKPRIQLARWLGESFPVGARCKTGNLTLIALPFLSQDDYDKLLWRCDFNFVRGEDSFVRAQWAARPFAWHIYPQEEEAHLTKLEAYLRRLLTGRPAAFATAYRDFSLAWNGVPHLDPVRCWDASQAHQAQFNQCVIDWCATLSQQGDLAEQLVQFVYKKRPAAH